MQKLEPVEKGADTAGVRDLSEEDIRLLRNRVAQLVHRKDLLTGCIFDNIQEFKGHLKK